MSKRILWILTIALSLAMLGFILLQVFWIRSATDLKEKQFKQLVNNTLSDVSRQLDSYYTSVKMEKMIKGDDLGEEIHVTWNVESDHTHEKGIYIDSEKMPKEEVIVVPYGEKSIQKTIEILDDTLLIIIYEGRKNDTIQMKVPKEELELKKIEKSILEQEILVKKVMQKMLLEEISFEKRIGRKEFDKILISNLNDRGIDLKYEYAILENSKSEIYITDHFNKKTEHYIYRTSLLSDKLHEKNTYLYIYFPGQKKLVTGSIGVLGSSSMILTLVVVVIFGFTLYVIYRQKRLSEIKNDFVNNMTHELKTPISTISLASQMLNDKSIALEKKNMDNISRIIQTESKRLGYQVEKVLQMAVFDQGHLILKKSEVDMHDLISTVVQNFKLQLENNKGQLECTVEADSSIVKGDRVHLMNVISNLFDNAVKYSPELPEVVVNTNSDGDKFRFRIKDNGIGISKENQKRIFDKFFRVSTGNVHDVQGFGLGLSYVKLIVEQHGGSITCSSELGSGTQFEIVLPLYTENA
jgi:two-component system, OmpR family, phosphate regulon sensor histidine kinase PhoR